jgi:hypothetical protein
MVLTQRENLSAETVESDSLPETANSSTRQPRNFFKRVAKSAMSTIRKALPSRGKRDSSAGDGSQSELAGAHEELSAQDEQGGDPNASQLHLQYFCSDCRRIDQRFAL